MKPGLYQISLYNIPEYVTNILQTSIISNLPITSCWTDFGKLIPALVLYKSVTIFISTNIFQRPEIKTTVENKETFQNSKPQLPLPFPEEESSTSRGALDSECCLLCPWPRPRRHLDCLPLLTSKSIQETGQGAQNQSGATWCHGMSKFFNFPKKPIWNSQYFNNNSKFHTYTWS